MSDEALINPPGADVEPPPTADYAPLPEATPADTKRKEYSSEESDLRQAASDLDKARAEGGIPKAEDEIIDRGYRWDAGRGEPVDNRLTVTPQRAAADLTAARELDI